MKERVTPTGAAGNRGALVNEQPSLLSMTRPPADPLELERDKIGEQVWSLSEGREATNSADRSKKAKLQNELRQVLMMEEITKKR